MNTRRFILMLLDLSPSQFDSMICFSSVLAALVEVDSGEKTITALHLYIPYAQMPL